MIKLIATDMDRTLLNSNHEVGKKSIEAIIKAQKEKDLIFVLASGRPTGAMKKFAKTLKLDEYNGYLISFNGAVITDCKNNKVIFSQGLTKEDAELVFDIANEYNTSIVTYMDDDIYTYNKNEYTPIEAHYTSMKMIDFSSCDELDIAKIMKFMIIDSPENIKRIYSEIKPKYEDRFFIAISDPHFIEIANKDVDKGKTLKNLSEMLGIKKDEIVACGDAGNDIAMLKYAGIAVAAENATDEVKAISNYVSRHYDDDLMEDVISKYVF